MMNMHKRRQIKVVIKAYWNKKGYNKYLPTNERIMRRSWLFYYFVSVFSNNVLFTSQSGKQKTVKEYFIDYKYAYDDIKNDMNIYSVNIKQNQQDIKIEMTKGRTSDPSHDTISFIC